MSKSFSIVIPAHNGEKYLQSALRSALNQTRPADELIVIDDASRDKTATIAQQQEFAGKVTYKYNEKPTGFVDAWNRAISLAQGDYVTILHQDDLLHRDYLLHIARALEIYPHVRHLYSACDYIDEHGDITNRPQQPFVYEPALYAGREYAHAYLKGVFSNRHIHRCPGVTTAKGLLLNECAYRRDAGHIADDDFFLRVGAFTDVIGIAAPLASFRHHPNSATSTLGDLTRTLADDYLFQVHYYQNTAGLLTENDIFLIHSLAARFINLLLFQGISSRNHDAVEKAKALHTKFDELLPGLFSSLLPFWSKSMWMITLRLSGMKLLQTIYVDLVQAMIRLRSAVRN